MPTIELRMTADAPLDAVVAVSRNTARFPEFMPDVKSIEILEKSDDGRYQKTSWVGRIPQFGLTVRWTQEEVWSDGPDNVRSDFKQLEGDYDKMEGYWEFVKKDGACEFCSYIDYEYNVPLVGGLVKKVIHHIVEQNVKGVMKAIIERAAAT